MKKAGITRLSFAFILLSFAFILFTSNLLAQNPEFRVKSFTHEENSLLARMSENLRMDDNDQACALILVRSGETGLGFTAGTGIVGNVEWKKGDYWVYVSQGTRNLKIFKQGIKTTEYLLKPIPKSRETYLLQLEVVRPKPKIPIWPVNILISTKNATLTIDGKKMTTHTGNYKINEGKHDILIEKQGYQPIRKTIEVNSNHTLFNFGLQRIQKVPLMIESNPPDATVYLDGVKLGQTPLSVFYSPGTYPVRVEKDGYVSIENQTLSVAAPQTLKKFSLAEDVGFITINTFKTAKVYINGKEYPEHTHLKLTSQLLKIKVTMPHAADVEKQIVLKRGDNLTVDLYPKVQTGTLQVAVTPFDADIELIGDAAQHYAAKGIHVFKHIPIGQYTLKVKAEGYRTETKTLNLIKNQILTETVKLQKGPSGNIEMVFVKGGTFQMGCTSEQSDCNDDEKPVHTVTVSDFYMGKYEVTQKQWKEIMGNNPSYFKGDNLPVERVSWNDIQEFLKKLNQKTGMNYRLPTEAEWEYAARGGVKSRGYKYAGSNDIDEVAWHDGNSGNKTHPVGQKKANELGIYDMSGNVWEWCSDWYSSSYYGSSPQNNPQGPSSGLHRVARGGSWYDYARYCRVARRDFSGPGIRYYALGFRLVLVP